MTNNRNDKIIGIIENFKKGRLSEDDRRYLNDWLTNKANEEIFDEPLPVSLSDSMQNVPEPDLPGIFDKVKAALDSEAYKPARPRFLWNRMLVAASVLLITAIGGILIWINQGDTDSNPTYDTTQSKKDDILPGADKATLTMANGKVIDLDKISDGSVTNQENKVITKAGGLLSYSEDGAQLSENISYHTLSTPRGGQFKLILPDGSKAWLNAASSIRFPSQFTGNVRAVEVTGEVYLEVKKNVHQPFTAKVKDQEITVLGTAFNINAYDDEDAMCTTLIEGSVKINRKKSLGVVLQPGQQAVLSAGPDIQVRKAANMEQVTAWTRGFFEFKNQDVEHIFRQLSRWYDVDVQYEGRKPTGKFTGRIDRSTRASIVLQLLQVIGMKYQIIGNKVIIKEDK